MRKKRRFTFFLSFVVILLGLAGCCSDQTFSGSRTGNGNQFLVDFEVLNTGVDGEMTHSQGEEIQVVIEVDTGDVHLRVRNENGTVAYRPDQVANGSFVIGIEESGTYTFTVEGSKAQGSVHFTRVVPIPER